MNLFTHLKNQISILDVVQEYTALKKAGIYWKGHCPFHHEKTASFTVSPHKEIFYCFGCHMGGDVITFIGKLENCTPMEAAKHLIDRYQIAIPETLLKETRSTSSKEKNRYADICAGVAQWCSDNLRKTPSVMAYLGTRGINPASINYFGLGYFPGGLTAIKGLVNAMRSEGFLANDLVEANILAQGKTVLYSPFEERIIFPIKDQLGRHCGFGGRVYKEGDERAKYYNSRENEFFTKGSLIFGLDLAKKSIQKEETVFLVEGYTDCIAMVQHGFTNTVATLGTACTAQHLKQLSRYAQKLVVLYDGDNAGHEAVLRLTQLCWQVSMDLSVVQLPAKEDPASLLSRGHNLKEQITQAMDIFDFFIASMTSNYSNKPLGEKLAVARKIVGIIEQLDDPLKRDLLLQKASKTLEIPFESLKGQLHEPNGGAPRESEDQANSELQGSVESPQLRLERKIFSGIMNNVKLFNTTNEDYLIAYLPSPLRDILHNLKNARSAQPSLDFITFFDMLSSEQQNEVTRTMLASNTQLDENEFEQLMTQLHKQHWKLTVHTIKLKLAAARASGDNAAVATVLNDFLELKKKMVPKDPVKMRGH